MEPNQIFPNQFTRFPNGVHGMYENCVISAPGLGISGGGGLYSVGSALGFSILSGTHLTYTNSGGAGNTIVATGNTGETTLTGVPSSYGTGSNTGTTSPYATAITDSLALYTKLKALTGTDISGFASALDAYNSGLGLGVFTPGVYTTAAALVVTASTNITLSGAGTYVFISTGGAITTGATVNIILTNGATAGNVFWIANNAITIGATNNVVGNFMSGVAGAITTGATVTVQGRLISPITITLDGTATTVSLPVRGGGSPLASNLNVFNVRNMVPAAFGTQYNAVFSAPVSANATFPIIAGGNLAFDNGTVPATTNSCRMYTFLASVSTLTGAVTLSVINGMDFPKHRPTYATDSNLGDGTKAIVGFLYVKNESGAVFIPGTTQLNALGVTAVFTDAYGWVVA